MVVAGGGGGGGVLALPPVMPNAKWELYLVWFSLASLTATLALLWTDFFTTLGKVNNTYYCFLIFFLLLYFFYSFLLFVSIPLCLCTPGLQPAFVLTDTMSVWTFFNLKPLDIKAPNDLETVEKLATPPSMMNTAGLFDGVALLLFEMSVFTNYNFQKQHVGDASTSISVKRTPP